MNEIIGGLIGIAVAAGMKALFSNNRQSEPELPVLCNQIQYLRGFPYGQCDSILLSGAVEGLTEDPAQCAAVIHLMNAEGYIRSTDSLNTDKDGDLAASSELVRDGRKVRFEVPLCSGAMGNVNPTRPLFVQLTIVGPNGPLSQSRFHQEPADFLGDGPTPVIEAIAWHMLLVAREERASLQAMTERFQEFFALDFTGRRQFRSALQIQAQSRQSLADLEQVHANAFMPASDLCMRSLETLCALLFDEIVQREAFHTANHALILQRLSARCPNDEVRREMWRLAEAIMQKIAAASAHRQAAEAAFAGYYEILGLPPGAS